jgi:hypothetical protein
MNHSLLFFQTANRQQCSCVHSLDAADALTREPRRLKPSDLAPILQCVSGPSPDLLVKILGVDTQKFYFATSSPSVDVAYSSTRVNVAYVS